MMSSISRSNNYEVTTELTWENGQLSLHGLSGISGNNPPQVPKPATWSTKPGDSTLESLVHQATTFNNNNFPQINNLTKYSTPLMPTNNINITSAQKWLPQNSHMHMEQTNPECSLAESSEKWRDNYSTSSHMQVEQNIHEGLQVKVQASSMEMVPPAGGKWRDQNLQALDEKKGVKKMSSCSSRSCLLSKSVRSETEQYCNNIICDQEGSEDQPSACASASATFCRDRDTTMMTWASFESPPQSFKTARNNTDDDSACQECSENQDGERMTKGESFRSQSSARRSRAAAIHNQSERRRRDRINEKMKALQRLVPNASKTDKASMLDEVIEYLKQLQAQVQMMTPQMVMPMGMQQQLQMSLLARMGMGMGMGMGMTPMGMGMGMGMGMAGMNMNNMIDANNLARNLQPHSLMHAAAAAASLSGSTPSFVPPQFTMQAPATIPTPTQLKPNVDAASALPNFNNAYHTFIAQQSMNMDFFNKVAALYRQQGNQASNKQGNLSQLPTDGTQRE